MPALTAGSLAGGKENGEKPDARDYPPNERRLGPRAARRRVSAGGCMQRRGRRPPAPSPGTTSSVSVTYPADHGTIYIGDQVQFQATDSSSGSGTQAATNAVWESNAPAVATVSSSGLVTAVSAGEATISAEVPAGGRGAQSIRVFRSSTDIGRVT